MRRAPTAGRPPRAKQHPHLGTPALAAPEPTTAPLAAVEAGPEEALAAAGAEEAEEADGAVVVVASAAAGHQGGPPLGGKSKRTSANLARLG